MFCYYFLSEHIFVHSKAANYRRIKSAIHLFTSFSNSFIFFYFIKDLFLAWVAVWMGSKLQLISSSLLLWCWFSSMTWVNKTIIKKINCHIFHVHIKCKCFVLIFALHYRSIHWLFEQRCLPRQYITYHHAKKKSNLIAQSELLYPFFLLIIRFLTKYPWLYIIYVSIDVSSSFKCQPWNCEFQIEYFAKIINVYVDIKPTKPNGL